MELTSPTAHTLPVTTPVGVRDALRAPDLRRLLPLWRHGVWLGTLFAVLACSVAIRLDVQQMRKDLDRNTRAQREANIVNERLHLEVASRRRAVAMEAVAAQLAMSADVRMVPVRGVQ
jgi:hypothetical protein